MKKILKFKKNIQSALNFDVLYKHKILDKRKILMNLKKYLKNKKMN